MKKKLLIVGDENFFIKKKNTYNSELVNQTFLNKKKDILKIGNKKNADLVKKISIFKIIKGFFSLNNKLIVLKDLLILFKSENLRTDLNHDKEVFIRNYYWSVFRSFIIILNFFNYFKDKSKKYSHLCTICYYNSISHSAITAFRSSSKKIYELQHGCIANHDAYPELNKSYFKKSIILKPDELILWRNETNTNFKAIKTSFSSYPQLKSRIKSIKKNIIGYSLGGFELSEPLDNNIIKFIKKYKEINWEFRFHPMRNDLIYYKDTIFYKKISNLKNITFIKCNVSLNAWLSKIDLHITHNSSVIIEASSVGLKSFTFNKNSSKYFKNQINNKNLEIINKDNHIKKIINYLKSN